MQLAARRRWVVTLALAAASVGPLAALPDDKPKWIRLDTDHFTLIGNAGERRVAAIGRNLERLREVLARTARGMTLHSPLRTLIYVFADEASFVPYNLGADGKPANVSGYLVASSEGNYVAIDASAADKPFPTIYHEYLHYVLHNTIPGLPTWLHEGLAEFYSTFRITGDTVEVGRPVEHHLLWLAQKPLMKLEELFAVRPNSRDYNEGERQGTFYAQAWALTHYLVIGDPQHRENFSKLLAQLEQGTDSETAFRSAFGLDLAAAQQALGAYVRARSYTFIRYTPDKELDEATVRVRPLERQEVLLLLGDLLAHHQPIQFEEAERHARAALAIDPSLPDAYLTLALLRRVQQRPGEAVELCEKALALAPGSARAHALRGASLFEEFAAMEPPEEADGTVPALLERSREAFRRSLELAPDDPESLAGLGRTFIMHRSGIEEGVAALARASQQLPSRVDILRDLVVITGLSGNRAGARRLLNGPLRQRATAEEVRLAEAALIEGEVERLQELVDSGEVGEAEATLGELLDETQDPELRRRLQSAADSLRHAALTREQVARFNEADAAAEAGDLERAAALFHGVAEQTEDPELRRLAESQAEKARAFLQRGQWIDQYNRAVSQANQGDLAGAIAALEALLATKPDAEVTEKANALLRDLREHIGRRR